MPPANPLESINQSAKAIQEVAKTTGEVVEASQKLGGWLDKIFGKGIEDTVALHWSDRVRAKRIESAIYDWEKLILLGQKVEERLKERGIHHPRLVPPKIALGIIENATIEEDDYLHSLWANLLTTSLDSSVEQISKKFISVLSDLTSDDAIALKHLCEQWFDPTFEKKSFHYGSLTYGATVDPNKNHNTISIITLNRLGLISPGRISVTNYSPNEDQGYSPVSYSGRFGFNADDFEVPGTLESVEITDFGAAFYKAVIENKTQK